ncbi:uncharacterized protein LOC141614782 [Silene latifolia]|uniref:uncharacterized protein LOC141614782 n=1 Tax=Silene latifolia TaxID=37657 RepID=UPI003D77ECB0
MVDNSKKPLYPNGSKFSLLLAVLKLFTLKAGNGWSDKSFTSLLELLCQMLPEGNELPSTTYECKKLLCPLSMSYQKIHACVKDCILYRKKYSELKECPKCGESRYKRVDNGNGGKKKRSPVKTLWYLPIIPKFKRFFSNKKDAEYMLSHQKGRNKDGKLRHVADAPQWRKIDRTFPEFGSEPRNLRLGLCTDGINPFGTLSTQHSCWPVMLIIYNIPPWLTTKSKYIMLTLLISGPKQPGNDIDVYLAPLIEDLKLLWNVGVEVFDASTSCRFQMHAMLYCTINDFPAYGNLSGYRLKTDKECPVCLDDTESDWVGARGQIFHLYVRHCIDVMHVEKNVFDSLIGTLLNIPNKTKDGVKARNDMAARGRIELKPIEKGKRIYIPPSCTTLSKKEKMIVCESLKGVKVPHGYSSNISRLVSIKDSKLVGMKSHDCHVMLTQLLPVAIRSVLPKHVRKVITKLTSTLGKVSSYMTMGLKLFFLYDYGTQLGVTEKLVGFLCPDRLCTYMHSEVETERYLTDALKAQEKKSYVMGAFYEASHWMLVVFCLRDNIAYIFDSDKATKKTWQIKSCLSWAWKRYSFRAGIRDMSKK